MARFDGQVTAATGAASGIGRAVADPASVRDAFAAAPSTTGQLVSRNGGLST